MSQRIKARGLGPESRDQNAQRVTSHESRVTTQVHSLAPTVFCPPTNVDRCLRELSEARRAP